MNIRDRGIYLFRSKRKSQTASNLIFCNFPLLTSALILEDLKENIESDREPLICIVKD